MACKKAHKLLGIELREVAGGGGPHNTSYNVADPVGHTTRDGLTWGGLSGGQQGRLHGRAYRRLGQSTYPQAETGD